MGRNLTIQILMFDGFDEKFFRSLSVNRILFVDFRSKLVKRPQVWGSPQATD